MPGSKTEAAPRVADGVLQQVDLIDREVIVRKEDGVMTFEVAPACEILLNGERVKLRMLQPRDKVRIAYQRRGGVWSALSLEAKTRS